MAADCRNVAVIFSEGPGNRIIDLEVQRDSQVRIEMSLDIEFDTIGDSKIYFSFGDVAQQIDHFHVRIFRPLQCRVNFT